jgi:hypothetical protein
MEFIPFVAALSLVVKIVDFSKFVSNRLWNDVVTQIVTWGAGIGVTFLLAATDYATKIELGGFAVSDLNALSLVLFGLTISSTGSLAYDFKNAVDTHSSPNSKPLTKLDNY